MGTEHSIHPTAIVDPRARLGEGVKIGPYVVIEGRVSIGDGTIIKSHSVLCGDTKIGRNCKIGPAAYVGLDPQHVRFRIDAQPPTFLIIGDHVTLREGSRIHRAIHAGEEHATRIGDNCFIMGAVHVAHDCVLERDVIMADAALLGGHCHIARGAFLGGGCTIHQFVRIGRLAIIAGNEAVSFEIPPFAAVRYGNLRGYNAIGCRRSGMDRATVTAVRKCYNALRQNRTVPAALADIRANVEQLPEVREFLDFIAAVRRGIPPSRPKGVGNTAFDGNGDVGDADDL